MVELIISLKLNKRKKLLKEYPFFLIKFKKRILKK